MRRDRRAEPDSNGIGAQGHPRTGPKELFRAIYASSATRDLRDEELVGLLDVARRNNFAQGITGALAYHDSTFIQVLEGPESAVEALLARIARDTRNTGVMVFDRSKSDKRSFARWSMGWARAEDLARPGFNPGILFLRDTPDDLVNGMFEVFREAARLEFRAHRAPRRIPTSYETGALRKNEHSRVC